MAFNDIEISEYGNAPIELYTFQIGTNTTRLTSYDEDVSFGGFPYTAVTMERSKIQSTQDLGQSTLKLTMSRSISFLDQFIASSPTDIVEIDITRLHFGDTDSAITFKGRVVNVKFLENMAEVTCQPIQTSLKRPGLRRIYQTTCPHVLYGDQCGVIPGSFSVATTLTGVSGLTITSPDFIISINPTFDATHFTGGFVDFNNGGVVTKRFITDHDNVSGILTLNLTFSEIAVGSSVTAFPGCDHGIKTCAGKFNIIENYGGFPFIPIKNPMNGTSVF